MGSIRRNSIKITIWIYVGFVFGAFNLYMFTYKSWFTTEQYGLTRSLLDISLLIGSFSSLGIGSFLYKFFPYYSSILHPKRNDILGLALMVSICGFISSSVVLYLLEPLVIQKFSTNSPLFAQYFYLSIPFAFFVLLFTILEVYSAGFHKGLITSMLKELFLRMYITVIIVLKIFNIISFEFFLTLFTFQYLIIVIALAYILFKENKLWLSFKISRATYKYRKKIIAITLFTFLYICVTALRSSIDALMLSAKLNQTAVGIFGFSAYLVSLLQVPLKSLVAITIPILVRDWKEKNFNNIKLMYNRSSINLLTFSLLMFFCIWLNFETAIPELDINSEYLKGKWVFFILALVTIIDLGTGINGQIIGTSLSWRFEFKTSILLTLMIIPLSYYFTVKYGIFGPALGNLISIFFYNSIRVWFLWRKYQMQPFSSKTLEVIVIALLSYVVVYYLGKNFNGFASLFFNTIAYSSLYIFLVYHRNISPDTKQIFAAVKNRLKFFK